MAEWGMYETPRTEVCTCIWQGFIHKGIFSDVLSDKMAEIHDETPRTECLYMYLARFYPSYIFRCVK